jgi:feruloyl esterase
MNRTIAALGALFGAAMAPGLAHAATGDCAGLTALALPHASVTSAEDLAQYPAPADVDPKGPPPVKVPFCRVKINSHPTPDSDIRIELWVPSGGAWNGRYLQVGNGGFAGRVPYRSLMAGLRKGYAVAGTDDGHESIKDDDSTDATWALHHPEKVKDFGWRALKETTDLSKTGLAAYAGPPKFSYFNGCSDGGREALMEAQRYPEDFDGIVAGDPANDWTHLQAAGALGQQTLFRAPAAFVPMSKLPALTAAAVKACGDETGLIENPLTCRFDPAVIECKGAETDQCLTKAQVATVRALYAGERDAKGRLIMPGLEPGAEAAKNGWGLWVLGDAPNGGDPSLAFKFNRNFFAYVVYGDPDYDLKRFRYGRDMPAIERKFAPILNSTSPDLSAFQARGGKLIQYHGWADPAIPAKESIRYFQTVQAKMGDTSPFYRLFMAPGMLHCAGGPGPSAIDWQAAISAWVEKGAAPDRILAAKFVTDDPAKGVAYTRPLCAFPKVAAWTGVGDKTKAESFTCAAP